MTRAILAQASALTALALTIILAGDLKRLVESPWLAILVGASILVAVVLAIVEIEKARNDAPLCFRGDERAEKVQAYMVQLLGHDGQCVVSSNDLSWATGRARQALLMKANSGSLILLMPEPNELSRSLKSSGAKTFYYGNDQFRFRSRFTLINYERAGSWVAIGSGGKNVHIVREFRDLDDPVITLTQDLIKLAQISATTHMDLDEN